MLISKELQKGCMRIKVNDSAWCGRRRENLNFYTSKLYLSTLNLHTTFYAAHEYQVYTAIQTCTHWYCFPSSPSSSAHLSITALTSSRDINANVRSEWGWKHMTLQLPCASDIWNSSSSDASGNKSATLTHVMTHWHQERQFALTRFGDIT